MADSGAVWAALSSVQDPELGYSITELGLVYGVEVDPDLKRADISMTFTAPGCPFAPIILEKVHESVSGLDGLDEVHVEVVWDPLWDPYTMCSEDILIELGLD